jgi:hypothetical protein
MAFAFNVIVLLLQAEPGPRPYLGAWRQAGPDKDN